jgi:hypothetical protein
MKRFIFRFYWVVYVVMIALVAAGPVSAHDGPTAGNEWLMADWMLLSFLVVFGAGLVAFIVALRRGLLSNLEDAKYYILTVEEQDYYTPEWAKEENDEYSNHFADGSALAAAGLSKSPERE